MEFQSSRFYLVGDALWTGNWWEPLPNKNNKPVQELAQEVMKLLDSGMEVKDVIPYLTKEQEKENTQNG